MGAASAMAVPCAARTLLPRSGLEVSRLGLGLAHLHLMTPAARRDLIDRAIDLGITHLDTSRFYGDGLSETTLGEVLGPRRRSVTITTKFGLLPTPVIASSGAAAPALRKVRSLLKKLRVVPYPRRSYTAGTLRAALERSLAALRTDVIDIYHVHEPPPDVRFDDDLLAELQRAKASGKVRLIGVSGQDVAPIVDRYPGVFDVLQCAEAAWQPTRHVPDITHSVLSPSERRQGALKASEVRELLQAALARRPCGAVIVQTGRPERLEQLLEMAAGR